MTSSLLFLSSCLQKRLTSGRHAARSLASPWPCADTVVPAANVNATAKAIVRSIVHLLCGTSAAASHVTGDPGLTRRGNGRGRLWRSVWQSGTARRSCAGQRPGDKSRGGRLAQLVEHLLYTQNVGGSKSVTAHQPLLAASLGSPGRAASRPRSSPEAAGARADEASLRPAAIPADRQNNEGQTMCLSSNPDLPIIGALEASDRFFQFLRRAECDLLAGLDLDGLAGCRVAAHAGRALAYLEDTKAADADSFALLQVLHDLADETGEDGLRLLF